MASSNQNPITTGPGATPDPTPAPVPSDAVPEPCPTCGGKGEILHIEIYAGIVEAMVRIRCPHCSNK